MNRLRDALSLLLLVGLFLPASADAQQPRQQAPPASRMDSLQRGMMGPMPGMMPGMMRGGMMPDGRMQGGMMQGQMMQMMRGMHRRMMQSPMHRAGMMTHLIPSLADTLGLSADQVDRLRALRSEADARQREHREQMMEERSSFRALFEDGQRPPADAVRNHLSTMSDLWTDLRAGVYETMLQMREVLTDEQRRMLDGQTPHQIMHQVMSTMSMTDMMQMMRSMHGAMMPAMQGGPMGGMHDGPMHRGPMGGGQMDGGQMDGSQMDGSQMNDSQKDGGPMHPDGENR